MNLKDTLRDWMEAREPNVFLTANYGYAVKQGAGERELKHLLNVIQRDVYGRNWSRLPPEDRIEAIGVWERQQRWSNPHCHIAANMPRDLARYLIANGPQLWKEISRRGQLDVSRVRRGSNVVGYITKALYTPDHLDRLFVYGPAPQLIDRP
jgi:hypothetical protein